VALRRIAQSFLLICLLAFAAVQSTGVGASFLCLCSGQAFLTTAAECHGPHGEHCLTTSAEGDDHQCGDEPCDTEQHASVTDKLVGLLTTQVHAPEVVLGVIERILSFSEMLRVRPAVCSQIARYDRASRPPPGVFVARTIGLQI
jgi:hypothetical protein